MEFLWNAAWQMERMGNVSRQFPAIIVSVVPLDATTLLGFCTVVTPVLSIFQISLPFSLWRSITSASLLKNDWTLCRLKLVLFCGRQALVWQGLKRAVIFLHIIVVTVMTVSVLCSFVVFRLMQVMLGCCFKIVQNTKLFTWCGLNCGQVTAVVYN